MTIRWTADLVIHGIHAREKAGLPLSTDKMNRTCPTLFGAGKRIFGSWTKALEAANIDPATVKAPRVTRTRWSRELIVERIQEHAKAGHDLAAHRLAAIDAPLVASGPSYWGSWDRALEAAGFDPAGIRLNQEWTPERVLDRLRELDEKRADLSDSSLAAYDGRLYGACATHFKSLRAAIEAAGIDRSRHARIREDWTKESLLAEIGKMAECGILPQQGLKYIGAYSAAVQLFGSIEPIYEALKLDNRSSNLSPLRCSLRKLRERAGASQEDLGARIGKSGRSVGLYETMRLNPTLETALRIAETLGCRVEDIWAIPKPRSRKTSKP